MILLRSARSTAHLYLDALHARGIPAASDSGESILDSAETETLMNLLRVLDNAHQDIPLAGVLMSPLFCLRADVLARARAKNRRLDLCDALRQAQAEEPELAEALQTLRTLRRAARELSVDELLGKIDELTQISAVYGAMEGGSARRAALQQFYEIAALFSEGGRKSLHQFIAYVDMLREQRSVTAAVSEQDAVTIMTIHKSKGLEFPVVILGDLSHSFNQSDLKKQVLFHRELGAASNVYDRQTHTRFPSVAKTAVNLYTARENVSEELRVLYVAMTRAQDMLLMYYSSEKLDKRLMDLSTALSPDATHELARQAGCMGDWILLTALMRTEAGALHAVGGKPEGCAVSEIPWRIEYHAGEVPATGALPQAQTDSGPTPQTEDLARALAYRYPHEKAAALPAKITATQLKGRQLDDEAADGRPQGAAVRLRGPMLLTEDRPLTPAQRGTAVHQAMQYLDFADTGSLEAIRAQLARMVSLQLLSPKQAEAVPPERLYAVFTGPLGEQIRQAGQVIREFKFSILVDAGLYFGADGAGEQILLQGVTDCCLICGGGLTVIDFKTDRVAPGGEREAGEKYRPQLDAYSLALSRIFRLPVRRRILYFFATDTPVEYE